MTLQEYTDNLPNDQQFSLAIRLTKLVIPIWEKYADSNTTTYRDTVVGLTHSVNKNLLRKTVSSVEEYFGAIPLLKPIIRNTQLKFYKSEFREPIVALQDDDWKLPNEVLMAFYSIRNLLDLALGKDKTGFDESTIYVIVNQAIDALESSQSFSTEEIRDMLYNENGR
jgi:hypothetical protein